MLEISKMSGTTIIITTHYIEEARKADRVGLMRDGKLLAEQSPDFLLEYFNQPSLEDVFLKLCIRDHDTANVINSSTSQNLESIQEKVKKNLTIHLNIYFIFKSN